MCQLTIQLWYLQIFLSIMRPSLTFRSPKLLYNRFGFKAEEFVAGFYEDYLDPQSRASKNAFRLRLRRWWYLRKDIVEFCACKLIIGGAVYRLGESYATPPDIPRFPGYGAIIIVRGNGSWSSHALNDSRYRRVVACASSPVSDGQ